MLDGEEFGKKLEAATIFSTKLIGMTAERCAPVSIPGVIALIIAETRKAMFPNLRFHLNKTNYKKISRN